MNEPRPAADHTARIALSVCIIAKDAASQIGDCIDSVGFADEVLVVDSGSVDATRAIAEVRGCRVIEQAWLGYGKQKQLAVAAARNDWVLCLDIDERVTPELEASIRKVVANGTIHAFKMPRRNRFLGRWLAHGEGYPDWSLRLFHRQYAGWSNDPVHEAVITTESIGHLQGAETKPLLHAACGSAVRSGCSRRLRKVGVEPPSAVYQVLHPEKGFSRRWPGLCARGGWLLCCVCQVREVDRTGQKDLNLRHLVTKTCLARISHHESALIKCVV